MLVAGGIFTTHHIQDIVVHLLCTTGSYESLSLLGDHIGNIPFLGIEVITHRFRFVLLITILKQRVTELFTDRVETELGKHQAAVQAHLYIFSL